MLDKHLIAKTAPVANEENIVLFGEYRITVLYDRLFRIEKSKDGEFSDLATQSVWFRNMPAVCFEVTRTSTYVNIATDRVTLHLEADLADSYIIIDGKRTAINNEGNLLGTTRTLDCCDGDYFTIKDTRVELGVGVCSRTGLAVIDDTSSLRLDECGRLMPKSNNEFDLYVFAYGTEYREAVKALYAITGKVPMLPRFAFGNWWSRYHAYSDEEYLHLMDKFAEYGIPFTVATVDMDWHYSNDIDRQKKLTESGKMNDPLRGTTSKRVGWTGYSWNTELFPDYKRFLNDLKERGLKTTLNLHPAEGVRFFEDMYEEMAVAMGIDPKTEERVKFDIANDDFVDAYFKILHHPYERDGVDFWWIDWQQGTSSAMEGLDPLWALNHYHYYDNGRDGKHPLIMSRYAGIGSHRYPIGFSGDTHITWDTLSYLPYFTLTSTNVGYTWWGHDLGGHFHGQKEDELYLRFLQFGVFNPLLRLHCANSVVLTQEPWAYKSGISELAREAMLLRHRLIPFLYTANRRVHSEGLGLMEPMYYAWPDAKESYEVKNQYLFAGELIVAPVTERSDSNGIAKVRVWLPEGKYTDVFTGDVYEINNGGRWVDMYRHLNSIPVLAKSGTVIPMSLDGGNSSDNPKKLSVEIYNGNNTYVMYEDNEVGVAAYTTFKNSESHGKESVTVSFSGNTEVLPDERSITLKFKNIVKNTSVDTQIGLESERFVRLTVLKNGKPTEYTSSTYSTVSVTIPNVDYTAEYCVEAEYSPLSPLCKIKREALLKLQEAEGIFAIRKALSEKITEAESSEQIKKAVFDAEINERDKYRITETML